MTDSEQSQGNNHEGNDAERKQDSGYCSYNPMRIIKWHRNLKDIDRFTFWIAVFTFFLFMSTIVQVLAYIESERAYLVIEDINFMRGEPSGDEGGLGLVMVIKNVGKHEAVVKELNVKSGVFIIQKQLPDYPNYVNEHPIRTVIPPIPPQEQRTAFMSEAPQEFAIPREDVLKGVTSGNIPLRVFGFIDYGTGYWFSGRVGFCFVYVPANKRLFTNSPKFQACDNPHYT